MEGRQGADQADAQVILLDDVEEEAAEWLCDGGGAINPQLFRGDDGVDRGGAEATHADKASVGAVLLVAAQRAASIVK